MVNLSNCLSNQHLSYVVSISWTTYKYKCLHCKLFCFQTYLSEGFIVITIVFPQFVMGLLRLGFVAVYLSDPIISGFTTGAAILVFTSQVKHILGLPNVPRYTGAFAVVKVCHWLSFYRGKFYVCVIYCVTLLSLNGFWRIILEHIKNCC